MTSNAPIPIWDNKPETFDEHFIEVDIYVRQFPKWKEEIAIAKILGSLQGQSKQLLQALSEVEREKISTKAAYRSFLRGHLLEVGIPERGRSFRSWLKLRRQPKEGMRLFLTRHRQLLTKMEATLNEGQNQKSLISRMKKEIAKQKLDLLLKEKAERLDEEKWQRYKTVPRPKLVKVNGIWVRATEPDDQDDDEDLEGTDGQSDTHSWQSNSWWKSWWQEEPEEEASPTIKDRFAELSSILAHLDELPRTDRQTRRAPSLHW